MDYLIVSILQAYDLKQNSEIKSTAGCTAEENIQTEQSCPQFKV